MSALIEAADSAYPFDYGILPDNVRVILGYVGGFGNTPHIWSTQEVATARATGRLWCAIWVPPQRALTATDGEKAAAGMLAALPQYAYRGDLPVFLDIEHKSYVADPAGAQAAVRAWQTGMNAGGYRNAVAYLPLLANSGWVADWSGHMPDQLPAGWRGQQFIGEADRNRYDLSVFNPDVFPSLTEGDFMTEDDWIRIKKMMDDQRGSLIDFIKLEFGGTIGRAVQDLAVDQLEAKALERIETALKNLPAVGGPSAADVAAELRRTLRWPLTVTWNMDEDPAQGAHAVTDGSTGPV